MTERSTLRLFVLRVLVMTLLATLFGRLWFLQVQTGEDYDVAAVQNRVREVVEPAPRGEVYDARGVPLVRNRTALVVSVDRAALRTQPDAWSEGGAFWEVGVPEVSAREAVLAARARIDEGKRDQRQGW